MCTENITKERFKNVDFLRFLFAVGILLYHFGSSPGSFGILLKDYNSVFANIFNLFRRGSVFVDFFFIIAGFFLFKNMKKEETFQKFIVKKFIRLLPVIYLYIVLFAISSLIFTSIKFNLVNNIPALLLLDSIGFTYKSTSCIPHAWFVDALFWTSLFYFSLNKIFDRKYVSLFIWLLIIFGLAFMINFNAPNFIGNWRTSFVVINHGIVRALTGLGIGYFIFQLNINTTVSKTIVNRVIFTILEIYSLSYIINYTCISAKPQYNIQLNFIILFSILLYSFIKKLGFIAIILENNISSLLGQYSYSIYIMHLFIRELINSEFIIPRRIFVLSHPILIFIIGIIVSILFGIIIYHFFEKPVTNYLKKKFLTPTRFNCIQK